MRFPVRIGVVRSPVHLISRRALSNAAHLGTSTQNDGAVRFQGRKWQHRQPGKSRVDTTLKAKLESTLRRRSESRSRGNDVSQGHDPRSRLRLDTSQKADSRHGLFRSTVFARFQLVLNRLHDTNTMLAGLNVDELHQQGTRFMDALDQSFQLAEQNVTDRDSNPLFWNLRDAFIMKDIKGLTHEIQYSFQSFIIRQRFSKGLEASHKKLLDFRFPHEWFPATRALQRTIHVHVGPTNSGKTYNALKALENSKRGVYAGPLRLLATEVYQRMNAKGKACALLTGEEVRIPEDTDSYFKSCTVEMTPLNEPFDVAVIDEIQMIGDPQRGSAWTSAILGVQAKEVHVCGEERTAKLIQSIAASLGDKCIIHRYQRLSPLETMNKAIDGDYKKLQKGDCIVAFSRLNLHTLKRMVEKHTGKRCAIIYGSLPPEVRVQQAALFNDPDNDYDFIVASDAIGMGLNLEIRRVILESVYKYDGSQNRMLTFPEIKQIGGRAGRYRTAANAKDVVLKDGKAPQEERKVGLVTTMDKADLRSIRRAFNTAIKNIGVAYIQPPAAVIERFSTYFPPDTPLSFILMRIKELASVSELYQLGFNEDSLAIADIIQDLPLTIYDRLTLCNVPVSLRQGNAVSVLRALARVIAENSNGDLLSIQEIPLEFLDVDMKDYGKSSADYLYQLESLHVAMNQYIWLSYRYSGMFRSQALAFHVRSLIEAKLIDTLDKLDFTEEDLEKKRKSARKMAKSREMDREALGEGEMPDVEEEFDDIPIDEEMERKLASQVVEAHAAPPQEAK